MRPNRRRFLQQVAAAGTARLPAGAAAPAAPEAGFPRVFSGRRLAMIAFPLGGVAAGSISLGGRGQLRDWEIFNKPDKGNSPPYAFPAIWARAGKGEAVARVLESRLLPPYEGPSGLGSNNAPGLSRLAGATFTGEYPLARVEFRDARLPVRVRLEAFSPFIPHDPEESGLPVAVLRYRVANPGQQAAAVSIAWSIENPVRGGGRPRDDGRVNQLRLAGPLQGILMSNPGLAESDPLQGEFALAAMVSGGMRVTALAGWPRGGWWNSPMLFWDDFTADGELGPQAEAVNKVGSLCLSRTIAPGASEEFTFLLAWRFPNRTPERCGWRAPKGEEQTVIGNHYCRRFAGAWEAAEHAARNLAQLERRTRQFAARLRASTLPAAVKEAASANLSTLATTTCFRTADGEFHGFEGSNNTRGCCPGNCTHVWNYETTTTYLFPTFARSLRGAAFGYSLDDAGAIHFRQLLPDGKERSGFAAADGQMGQIVKAYHDWRLSGDTQWLRAMWPRIKKALEFAWVPGGWDADRDGVMEGVQHNTYDVEFYGPNPQCGIYYLAALRAGEEMAREVGDASAAAEYRRLFENGSRWIDANLFNGEYYVQKVRGVRREAVAPALLSSMGSEDTEKPEFQVGEGCLADQLVGQYLADLAGLGALVDRRNIRKAMESVYRYNRRPSLAEHDSVQRTYALNEEPGLLVCDYGKAPRPRIPFPYYAEVWTGLEYTAAVAMIEAGLVEEGVRLITDLRSRYDGERRNPWDEAECGHHYARAMAAWSAVVALSGFEYHAARGRLAVRPKQAGKAFRCFWSAGTGWGVFSLDQQAAGVRLSVQPDFGRLRVKTIELAGSGARASVLLDGKALAHEVAALDGGIEIRLREAVEVREGSGLRVTVTA